MLRALVEFRIRGVKVSLAVTPYSTYADSIEPGVDQHSIFVPPIDSRYLHWRQNLDDGEYIIPCVPDVLMPIL